MPKHVFSELNITIIQTSNPRTEYRPVRLGKEQFSATRLNLFCDERRDIRWNIVWARGKSWGQSLKDFPRSQAIFHRISRLKSRYRHSQLKLQLWPTWRSILEELILRIAPTAGQYGKILPSKLHFCYLSENISLCFNKHSAVKSHFFLIYCFSIHNDFWN